MKIFSLLISILLLASCGLEGDSTYQIDGKKYRIPKEYFIPSIFRDSSEANNFDPDGGLLILAFPREELAQRVPEYNLRQGPRTGCCNTTFTVQIWETDSDVSMQERYFLIEDYQRENIALSSLNDLYKVTGRFQNRWYYFSDNPELTDLPQGKYFFSMCSQLLDGLIENCIFHVRKNSIEYSLHVSHNNLQYHEELVEFMFKKFEEWEI